MRVAMLMLAAMLFIPTRSALGQCVGDCDRNYTVSVNEVVRGVNILFELAEVATCPSFDVDNSGGVSVGELVLGVNNLLNESCIPISDSDRIFGNADSDTTVRIPIRADLPLGAIHLELAFTPPFMEFISGCQFEQVFAFEISVGSVGAGTFFVDVVTPEPPVTVPQGDALVCSLHLSSSAEGTLSLRLSGTVTLPDGQTVPISGSGTGEIFAD